MKYNQENTDGHTQHYRYVNELYLISMLSQSVYGIIYRGISAPGHGRELIYGLSTIEKMFLLQ